MPQELSLYARKFLDVLSAELVHKVNEFDDEENGAKMLGCFLLIMEKSCVERLCPQMLKDNNGGFCFLLDILGYMITPDFLVTIGVIVNTIKKIKICISADIDHRYIGTIFDVCRKLPEAVFLFSCLEKQVISLTRLL